MFNKILFLKALEYYTYKNNFFYDLRTKGARYEILKKKFFSKFDEIWVIFAIFFFQANKKIAHSMLADICCSKITSIISKNIF